MIVDVKNLIVSFILGIIMLAVGVGLGVLFVGQKVIVAPSNTTQTTQTMSQSVKDLSSKVVSVSASGSVTKISGRSITLSQQGDSMVIGIKSDAKIYSFISTSSGTNKGASTSQQVDFSSIKVGNNVSVNIKVLPSGEVEGFSVIILPPVSIPAPK